MALRCKLCRGEFVPMAGGRCGSCRRIVCGECAEIVRNQDGAVQAVLCVECGGKPPKKTRIEEPKQDKEAKPRRAWKLPKLKLPRLHLRPTRNALLIALTAATALAVFWLAILPVLRTNYHVSRIQSHESQEALVRIGKPAVGALLEALQGGVDSEARAAAAATVLGRIETKESVLGLIEALGHKSAVVRGAAEKSLYLLTGNSFEDREKWEEWAKETYGLRTGE